MNNSMQQSTSNKRTYLVEEIAEILEISKTSAYKLVKEGCFSSVRVGSCIRVSRVSFDNWLDSYYERNV